MKTVTNYLKNVTKSVMYAAVDVGNDMMPNVGEFANSNKDFLKSTYAALKNPKTAIKKSITTIQSSKIYQALDYGVKNTFEDLRTGNFYNKEREERDSLKLSGLGDENEWGDLSDFGIDDDWESSLDKSSKKDEITTGDLEIINAVEGSSAAGAAATVNAVIKSSEYQVKAARTNTANIYMQNEKLFGGLHQDLSVIGATMDSIHKITSAALQNIDKNTSDFFTAELKLSQERNAMLKEILEMQRNIYTSAIDKEKEEKNKRDIKTKKNRWKDVQFNGVADIDSYFEVIKSNVNNAIQSLGIPAFNEDSNMLATIMTSPFKGMMQAIVKGVIPVTVKAASKELDETISGVFGHLIARMANAKNGEGGILGLISKVFGINTRVNSSIDTSRYEKGPIPFDGITRKAIADVIPTYLRRIEAHLTGKPEQTFNYESGKWVTMQSIKKDYGDIRKNAVRNANNNLRELMDPAMKRVRATNVRDAESWDKAYEEFQQYMYDNNGIFNPKISAEKNNISASKYPNFYKHYNQIKNLFINSDYTEVQTRGGMKKFHSKYSKKINISKDVLEAKDIEERKYRDLESAIGGITQVVSAMGIDSHGKWDKDYKKFNIKESILYTKDSIGNTVFDYLRNINQELTWWRTYGYEDLYGTLINSNFQGGGSGRRGSRRPRNNRPDPNNFTYQQYSNRRRTTHTENFNKISLEHRDHKTERERYQQKISQYNESTRQKAIKAITSGDAMDLAYLDDEQAGNYIKALIGLLAEDNSEAYVNELGGYNTDIAGYIDKNFIKTGAKSLKDIRIIAEKKAKEQEEKEKEDKEEKKKTFLDTLVGKVKETGTFTGGIVGATGEVVSNLLMSADKAIYEMMYKSEIEDEDHEKYHGFMDMMQHKLTGTFDKIKEYVKGNVFDPFKKWLGIDKDGETTKRFTDELKNIGKNIWGTFVNANKDIWGPIGNQVFTDIGIKKGGQTSVEKNRANERKKHLNNIEEMHALTSIYDRNFVRLMSEYGLNFIEYGTDFEKAKEDLEKKVKEYYIKATNDMKEVTNKEEAKIALNYVTSLENKQLEEIAKNLGINIENMKRIEILDAITNYTKTNKEFNSRLARNSAIEAGYNLDVSTDDVINNATSVSVKEKSRYNQSKTARDKVNTSTLVNPNAATRGIRNAINSGIKYRITEDEFGNREMVIEHMSDKAIRRAITQQNKRNARRHKYTTKNGAVIDHGEFGPGKKALNSLKGELQRKQKIREKSIKEEGVEYKQKGSRDIRNWALSAGPEERASYCVANGFNGTPEEKERILIGLGISKEQLIGARKAENYDDALNKMWLRYNVGMYAKGTNGVFATGDAILSKGEIALRKSVDGLFEATKVPKTGLYNLGSVKDGGTAILRDNKSGTTERGDLDRERLYAKKNGLGKVQNFAEATSDVTINGNKLTAADILSEAKKNIPEAGAGGLVGGILSMVLGLAGGPIVGAALGAGASIISKSGDLKEKLFGKVDENGKRDGSGFISKTIVNAAQKYAPDMFKYGLAGIIPGLLTPLGPIGGLLVGATIGLLKNNEKFTNKYFGENGKLTLKSKEKEIIQKLLPGTAKGAAIGIISTLFGGPFGILGNAALGAAIGMMTSTDAFKDSLFGKEMKDGTRDGGLLGAIKESFEPVAEAGREFKDKLLGVVENNIVRPIQDFVTPFIHELPRIASWLPNKINDFFENHFGRSLTGIFKDFVGKPLGKVMSKVVTPITSGILNVVTSPMKLLGAAGNSIRRSQIRNRQADYMTAKERLEWGQEHGLGNGSEYDQALADIGSGKEGSMSVKTAKDLREALALYGDTEANLTISKKKTEKDINNVLDSFNVDGKSLSSNTKKRVRAQLAKGNIDKAKEIIQKQGLDGSENGLTEKQYDELFGEDGNNLDKLFSNYNDINQRRDKLKNLTSEDKENARVKIEEALNKMGITGEADRNGFITSILTDPKQREKLLRNLDTEITDREANQEEKTTEETINDHAESIDLKMDELIKVITDMALGNTENLKQQQEETQSRIDKANEKAHKEFTERKNDFLEHIDMDKQDAVSKDENIMDQASAGESTIYSKATRYGKNPLVNNRGNRALAKAINTVGVSNVAKHGFNTGRRLEKITTIKSLGKTAYYIADENVIKKLGDITNEKFKGMLKILKNRTVLKFINGTTFDISDTDFEWLTDANNYGYLPEFVRLCKALMKKGHKMSDYGSFVAVKKRAYSNNINQAEEYEEDSQNPTQAEDDVDRATNQDNETPSPEPTPDLESEPESVPNYGIGTALLGALDTVGGVAIDAGATIGKGLWEGAKVVGKAAWNGAKALGKKAAGAAWNGVKTVGNKINDATGGVLKKVINDAGKVGSNIFNGIKDTAGKLKKVDKIGPGPNDYGIIKEKSDGSFEPDTSDSKTKEIINRVTKAEKEENEAAQAQIKMQEQMNKITAEPTKKEPGILSKLLGGVIKFAMITPFIKPLIDNILKPIWENAIKPLWNDYISPSLQKLWTNVLSPALKSVTDWLKDTGFPWIVENILNPLGKIIVDAVHNKIADDWDLLTHQSEASNYSDPETGFTKKEKELAKKGKYTDHMKKLQVLNRITSTMSGIYSSGNQSFDNRYGQIQHSIIEIRNAYKAGASSTEIAEHIKKYQQNDYKGDFDELPTIINGIIKGDTESMTKFAQAMDNSITNKDVAKNTSNARAIATGVSGIFFGPIGALAAYNAVNDNGWKDSEKYTGKFKANNELSTDLTNSSSTAEDDVNASIDTNTGSGSNSIKPLSKYGRFKGSIFGSLDSKFDSVMHTIQINRANERTKELEKKIEEKTGKSIDQVYEEYGLPKDDVYSNRRKSIGLNYGSFNPQNLAQVDVPTNDNIDSTLETIEKAKAGTVSIFSSNYWSNNDGNNVIASAYNNAMKIMAIPSIIIRDCMRSFLGDVSSISNKFTNSGSGSTSSSNLSSMFDSSAGIQFNFASPDNSLSTRLKSDSTNGSTDANNNDTTKDTNKDSSKDAKKDSSKDTKKDSSSNSKKTTSGKGKYGLGLYSKQIDPDISKIRFNANGDSEYQTIGDSGCGPAAAVNALESMHGRSKNVINAANFAIKGGYKERNGGTKPSFFSDYFASRGYGSQTTSNRNTLISNIRAGIPTVLMGQDKHGVSSSTPYGRNPHYVTATGVDSKGHVVIQDPESRYDNQLYSMSDVMKKTSFGVSAFGRGKYNKEVWWYLRNKMGFSEAGAAGVIANMEDESGVDPGVVSDYVKQAQGYTNESFTEGVNNGTISKDTFVNANLDTINPGLDSYGYGLVQWYAKDRKKALYERTVEKKIPIDDLVGQLDFLNYETTQERVSRYEDMINTLKTTNDPGAAASIFNEVFEVSGVAPTSRQNKARKIYEELKGTNGTPITGSTYNGVSSSSTTSNSSSSDSNNSNNSNNTSNRANPGIIDWLKNVINNSRVGMVFNSILGNNSSSGHGGNGIKPLSKYGRGEEIVPQIWKYLRDKGFTEAGTAGILGNMECESGFNLGAAGDGGTSFGLCQWHNSRGDAMKKTAGNNWDTNLKGQLDYLISELKSGYSNLYKTLTTTNSVKEAASQMVDKFEVCQGHETAEVQNFRTEKANKWFKKLTGKEGEDISDTSSPSSSDTTSNSSSSDSNNSNNTSNRANPGIFDWLKSVLNNSRAGMVFNSLIGNSNNSSNGSSSSSSSTDSNGSIVNASGDAKAVVDTANAEIGKVNYDDLGEKRNKYNDWWENGQKDGAKRGLGSAEDWCARFVSWVLRHAGVSEETVPNYQGCTSLGHDYIIKEHSAKAVTPETTQPGDLMFYSSDGGNVFYHTGIVTSRDSDGTIHTTEGNVDPSSVTAEITHKSDSRYAKMYPIRPLYKNASINNSTTTDNKNASINNSTTTDNKNASINNSTTTDNKNGKGDNICKPLSKYGMFKESLNEKSYQELHDDAYDLQKNKYLHNQFVKRYSVYNTPNNVNNYGKGTVSTDNSALISTIIKILYTIADNTDKLNTIVSILNDKLGIDISASDINSKTNKVNLKQKLMSSLSPSMITSTSKLNKYADDIDSNEINNIIKTMNLIASE